MEGGGLLKKLTNLFLKDPKTNSLISFIVLASFISVAILLE